MTDSTEAGLQGSREIAGALAFVGIICVLYPLADLILNNWPLFPGEAGWRYQVVGFMSQLLVTPLIGVVFLMISALLTRSAGVLKAGGWVSLLAAVVVLGATLVFVMDARELRGLIGEGDQSIYNLSSARAMVKNLISAAGFAYVGWGALRMGSSLARRGGRSSKDKDKTPGLFGT